MNSVLKRLICLGLFLVLFISTLTCTAVNTASGTPRYAWPVPGYNKISAPFGLRMPNGASDYHAGIDIPAPSGTPIVAAANGTVIATYITTDTYDGSDWGNYIKIQHSPMSYTLYAHCSPALATGQKVSKG